MSLAADADGFDAMLAETRRRAGAIDRLVDMIPARFYLGTENEQVLKARPGLDPAKAMPTSRLVMEAAGCAAASAASGSSGGKRRQHGERVAETAPPRGAANSRVELHEKLERRIAEMREERRRHQSATDKARAAEARAASKPEAQKPRSAAPAADAVGVGALEAGRLNFEPRTAALPFEAGVGKRGRKVRQLRAELRKHESEVKRVQGAAARGGEEESREVRKELALAKALQRARGEKVHDDVDKLRKAQRALEMKKKKGKEKWESRVENEKRLAKEQQAQRGDNLAKRAGGKRKSGKRRCGFEGKHSGFLNSAD